MNDVGFEGFDYGADGVGRSFCGIFEQYGSANYIIRGFGDELQGRRGALGCNENLGYDMACGGFDC